MFDLNTINQNFDDFVEKIKEEKNKKGGTTDERFWNYDNKGNKTYKIRFLPYMSKDGKWKFFVNRYVHYLNGVNAKGEKIFQKVLCPSTHKKDCYICEKSKELFSSPFESDQSLALQRYRKQEYFANVYIINDKDNSENEGQIKIFKFGKKVAEKILNIMGISPVEDDEEIEEGINVFDPIKGCNFKLVVKQVGGYPNYDSSSFEPKIKPMFPELDKEERIEKIKSILEKTYDLDEFVDEEVFPSYIKTKEIYVTMFTEEPKVNNNEEKETNDNDFIDNSNEDEDDINDNEIFEDKESNVEDVEDDDDDDDINDLFGDD